MKWKRPASGQGKKSSDSEPTKPFRKSDSAGGAADRGDAGERLSWPARDKQMRKVTYYDSSNRGGGSERTRLHRPDADRKTDPRMDSADPVVGWLVVVEGPGKGHSIEIGVGANPIGRDAGQKISLNFGDESIHREKHAVIVFDPKSVRFYLQGGNDDRNLTYLRGELVMSPTELHGGETLTIGQTTLKFIAFCGPDFTWF